MVVKTAPRGQRLHIAGIKSQSFVKLPQCLCNIQAALCLPQFEMPGRVAWVSGQKPLQVRDALFQPAHLRRCITPLPPGDIIVRHKLQISLPRRRRIVQSVQFSRGQGDHLLHVRTRWVELRRLRQ